MFGTHDFALFVASGLLLNVTPGADTLFVVTRSSTLGVRAGIVAALAIGAGCCVHVLAAALGLSAVLATSATAFAAVKWIGAAYLVYIGVGLLRTKAPSIAATSASAPPLRDSLRRVFAQGFLTNVLNPKVALFFLAFLPQFVDADAPHKTIAFLFLGLVFNVNGTLWCLTLAWSASALRGRVRSSARVAVWMQRAIGALLVGLGVKLALASRG